MINIVKLEIIAVIGYHIFLSSLVKYITYICICITWCSLCIYVRALSERGKIHASKHSSKAQKLWYDTF